VELRKIERLSRRNFTYYYKNNGLQNQSVLCTERCQRNRNGLDPNTFLKTEPTSLGGLDFSKDGSKVAYAISEA
jgi:prolyl oligopeptidase